MQAEGEVQGEWGKREPRAGQRQGATRGTGLSRGSRGRNCCGSKNGLRFLLLQFGFIFVSIYISFFLFVLTSNIFSVCVRENA